MKLIAYTRDEIGNEVYITPDGTLTNDIKEAKVYEEKWWAKVIYLILEIILKWGFTVKMKKI